ncbi:MAG TPA: MBL fold metallo-hydrolase [Phycisphaerae bacterium]|nr:MBL fold metallo-hydrolase [Phycisphaerae bacterium]
MDQELEYRYEPVAESVAALRVVGPDEHFQNVYVLGEKGSAALVDASVPEMAADLIRTLQANGWTPDDFRYLIITHEHGDHYGSAAALARWAKSAEVLAHVSAAWVMSQRRSRFVQCPWPFGEPTAERFAQWQKSQPATVHTNRLLWDGDKLQIAGKTWQVLHVPGHAAGHILLVDREGGVTIAGDVIQGCREAKGWLGLFEDIRAQRQSLQRLLELESKLLLMGHHHPLTGEQIGEDIDAASQRLDDLLEAVCEGLKGGTNELEALARLAFRRIFGNEPDPVPSYALTTVNAVLAELSFQNLARLNRQHIWQWVGD